ncbi:MAG: TonB-dependent receptor [Bryobacteraceae bacterium]
MNRILLAAILLSAMSVSGQTSLATITGTISDATGAIVANAPVEMRNRNSGEVFKAATSETGNYTLSQLPIGDYDLSVAVPGFKTYSHTSFHLAAAQTMREDVSLEVGQTSESVTVTAEASLLKTESSEVGQNVTLAQLNNLPVLQVGVTAQGFRDPFIAVRLVPGVRYANAGSVATMVVNGTPANTVQMRLDGATAAPTGTRLLGATMETQPSVDAVEEVSIQTSNFAAEYGTAGGAIVNMVSKSGTNAFHGTAYDYGTNEFLNAHQPYTGVRNKIRQYDWGFTFGGPVRIPKLYNGTNKTFFFFSYEAYRNKNIITNGATTVPIPAYRAGDFSNLIAAESRLITTASGNATDALGRTMASGTIFDPSTQQVAANGRFYRDPFPSNQIPVSRFDPIAVKVLALIPQPVGANFQRGLVTNNYQAPFDTSRKSDIPSIKIDQNMGSKGRLSFYTGETRSTTPRTTTGADAFPDLITASAASATAGTTIRLNYDYTVTPRFLLHLGAGWNDTDFMLEGAVKNFNALTQLGLVGQTTARYFPRIVTGVNGNESVGGLTTMGTLFPALSFERRPSGNVSASYVTGAHTYKFGAEYRLEKFPDYGLANTQGTYTFGANMTEQPSLQGITTNQGFDGFEFASFMLGGMSSNSVAAPIALGTRKSQTGLYVQDTWKVTRKMTLDYGLRWDYGTYNREQYGRNGSIGLAIPNPAASGRLGARQFEATCGCNFAKNYPFAYGPRLGMSYQISSKTVLRAGIGVVYNSTSTQAGASTNTASSNAFPNNSGQITGLFRDGIPANVRAVWPSFDPGVGQSLGTVIAMPALLDQNAGRPARVLQFNIGLQRELTRNTVVEASYVANRGAYWTANGLAPLNALNQNTLTSRGFNDFTSPTEAALLTTLVSNLTTGQRTTLAARGITGIPYTGFPTGQTVRQSLLDYPQYTAPVGAPSGLAGSPLGNTWYDSLQVNVTQRFSHGLSFNLNYNYSKNLDTMTSISDVFNRGLSKNLSVWDQPTQIRLAGQYVIPQLRNTGLAMFSNRLVSYALSDWGLSTYLEYKSAVVVARPTSNGTTPLSLFLGRGPGGAQLKKDASGNYMNPWSVNWTDYDGKLRTDPIDVNCKCYDPTKTQVLNPAAWENIPNGQWGADQSSIRNYRGVRTPLENASFSRNFRLQEKVMLTVRVEFTNIFNRTQLPGPTVTGNFATPPTKFTTGPQTGLYSGGFGTLNVLSGTVTPRAGTYVARITF